MVNDLRPRVGVENRLPEFIEEALHYEPVPADLLAGLAADVPIGRGTSGRPLFPLHAARRMRPDGRTGQGDGSSGADAIAGDSADRTAATGFGGSGVFEPAGCGDVARVVAHPAARVEPLLSRYCGSADRLWSRSRTADERCWNWQRFWIRRCLPEAVDEIGMSGDLTAAPSADRYGRSRAKRLRDRLLCS